MRQSGNVRVVVEACALFIALLLLRTFGLHVCSKCADLINVGLPRYLQLCDGRIPHELEFLPLRHRVCARHRASCVQTSIWQHHNLETSGRWAVVEEGME